LAEGETVALDATLHGRHTGPFMGIPPTGREVALRTVHFIRYRNGLEIETWSVQDRMGLMQQLGLIPDRPESTTAVGHR
jgi:predicted ester cyclase